MLANFRSWNADFWNGNLNGSDEIRAVPERTLKEIKILLDKSASKIDLKILCCCRFEDSLQFLL